jgi:hypothetical protein
MATESVDTQDIDKGFVSGGTETLDEYRQRILQTLQQPGFGNAGKQTTGNDATK